MLALAHTLWLNLSLTRSLADLADAQRSSCRDATEQKPHNCSQRPALFGYPRGIITPSNAQHLCGDLRVFLADVDDASSASGCARLTCFNAKLCYGDVPF